MPVATSQRALGDEQMTQGTSRHPRHPNNSVLPSHSHSAQDRLNRSTHTNGITGFTHQNQVPLASSTGGLSLDAAHHPSYAITSLPFISPNTAYTDDRDQILHERTPSFPFEDFLTPEYSSDNTHTDASIHNTPGVDELFLDHHFIDRASYHLTNGSSGGNTRVEQNFSELNTPGDLQGLVFEQKDPFSSSTGGAQLLSPQPSIAPSPPDLIEALPYTDAVAQHLTSVTSAPSHMSSKRKANHASLGVQTSYTFPDQSNFNGQSPNHSPIDPIARATSPLVTVSTYTRGDSPARPKFSMVRNTSRRSQASGSSHSLKRHSPHQSTDGKVHSPSLSETALVIPCRDGDEHGDGPDRQGLDPVQRDQAVVASISQLEEQRMVNAKNADVETWLATSETGSQVDEQESRRRVGRRASRKDRFRSRSTGAQVDGLGLAVFDDSHIPGPGAVVDEDSDANGYEDDEEDEVSDSRSTRSSQGQPVSPAAQIDTEASRLAKDYFPTIDEDIPPEEQEQEPLPRQFYRRTPWQDSARVMNLIEERGQPPTANAAMYRFNQQAAKFETASRAATWGTRGTGRRLSEGEINSIVEGSKIRHLSLSKRGRERGASIIGKWVRRVPSISKQKPAESFKQESSPERDEETASRTSPLRRLSSSNKPKSPSMSTGGAFMAMTTQLTAVGRGASAAPEALPSKNPFQTLKRGRSKSDLPKNGGRSKSSGLAALMTQHGGPPMPTLASPMQDRKTLHPAAALRASDEDEDDDEDDEDDEMSNEKAVRMEFKIRADNIIPTLEGFKTHARQLNPRMAPFLIDRIGQEQLRRYKKLVEFKVKHTQAVRVHQKCASADFCVELGGAPIILPPRTNLKDPDTQYAQYVVPGHGDTDDDETAFAEGVVTPALFPSGIPLPPVKRLPAEFECPLCCKVKKFQKPSDWTKHVHEDVQPFSCTFPNCTDPKSFKRKADWVRHENERHRHLERWQCNILECNHVCYRKDNFVQHLIREHKLPEPKMKSRGSGSSKARAVNGRQGQELDEVWRLLDLCHHETRAKPKDEVCNFCGNMCSTWKKVSAHLGKHMEQIALPVLELVRQRDVSPDTIISPIEQSYHSQVPVTSVNTGMLMGIEQNSLSPYPISAPSHYQGSSAGQSPVAMQVYPQSSQVQYMPGYHTPTGAPPYMQTHPQDASDFGQSHGSPTVWNYHPFEVAPHSQSFVPINGPTYPPTGYSVRRSPQSQIPRSQPLQHDMHGMHLDANQQSSYQQPQQQVFSGAVNGQQYVGTYGHIMDAGADLDQASSQTYEPISASPAAGLSNEGLYDPRQIGGYPLRGQGYMGQQYQY